MIDATRRTYGNHLSLSGRPSQSEPNSPHRAVEPRRWDGPIPGEGRAAVEPDMDIEVVPSSPVARSIVVGIGMESAHRIEDALPQSRPEPERNPTAQQAELLERRLSLLGLTVEVVAPCRPFAPLLPIALGAYPRARPDAPVDFQVVISPHHRRNRWDLAVGDRRYTGIAGADTAACKAEWCMVTELLKRLAGIMHVHAAVLATDEQSFLLVGASGAGKSTTSVALALAGCDLLTDDVAIIDQATLRPANVPRPIKLDQRSTTLLGEVGLHVPAESRIGEGIARSALPGLCVSQPFGPALRTIFFLQPGDRTSTKLTPISEADAVLRLATHSSTAGVAVGDLAGPAFSIAGAVQSYSLVTGGLHETVNTIRNAIGAASTRRPSIVIDS